MCDLELAISWRSVGDCGVFVAKTMLARASRADWRERMGGAGKAIHSTALWEAIGGPKMTQK